MRLKPNKRLVDDNEGVSFGTIIIIIVVLLFIASYFIPIPFFTDITQGVIGYVGGINEEEPDILITTFKIVQISTGDIIPLNSTAPDGITKGFDIEPDTTENHEDYKIVITTNAPRIVVGTPWKVIINSELHYTGTNAFEFNQNWDIRSGEGFKEFEYQFDHSKMAWDTWLGGQDWTEFKLFIFNPEKTAVWQDNFGTG